MPEVVRLVAVDVQRGSQPVLRSVSWTVRDDERWVVLGPNGAGKTTLLSLLAAQTHPGSGLVLLLGERLGAVDVFELRPRIGLSSALLADQIPREERVRDLVLTASYARVGRFREAYEEMDGAQADALLARLAIGHLAQRQFGTLSEGERKRAQIARSLMTDPELLLLDEPAAGLDLAGRELLVRTLAELADDPAAPAAVLVTHHVEEIPPGYTHALLLREGSVVAAGPVSEVLNDELVSATFGMDLKVRRDGGRFTARSS